MSKNLVIVESPAKAKTIKKYLGPDFEVMASYGHVRDLVPKDGAVDTEHGFAMKYQLIDKNEKHVRAIIAALKKADSLYLATDPDREGEAIAWHLCEHLLEKGVLKDKPVKRVVFYEITKREVAKAIAEPREVAADLVNAQQARRALDYLVGFNLSPLLWRKVQPGLSAGRVQSPALRLICERELEIRAFEPREYWSIEAKVEKDQQGFSAKLAQYGGDKVEQFSFTSAEQARQMRGTHLVQGLEVERVGDADADQPGEQHQRPGLCRECRPAGVRPQRQRGGHQQQRQQILEQVQCERRQAGAGLPEQDHRDRPGQRAGQRVELAQTDDQAACSARIVGGASCSFLGMGGVQR